MAERAGAARSRGARRRQPRLLYAAGPGDVLGTYEHWREGRDYANQVVVTYSSQFFDVCERLDCEALVLVRRKGPRRTQRGRFTFAHRPNRLAERGSVWHHIGQILYGLRLIVSAARFGADAAVVCEGTTHWFMLRPMRWLGVAVVPSIHSLVWAESKRASKVQRLANALAEPLFARSASATLCASRRIAGQVSELAGGRPALIRQFLPLYRSEFFEGMDTPDWSAKPFICLYVGRIEASKGVFDLLEIADRLKRDGCPIEFEVCGDGSALESLRAEIDARGLGGVVRCHGHCARSTMQTMYGRSHVVIAPTRSTLVEGFNQVVVEAPLAGRPVVTSRACPAMEEVRSAVVEVEPDDVDGYVNALRRLSEDRALYEAKRRACEEHRSAFLDPRNSWAAALERVLLETMPERFKPDEYAREDPEPQRAEASGVVGTSS